MTSFGAYLDEIKKNLARGDATEHTHRPALKKLLESVGQGIVATNEPTRILCGAPDFILTKGKIPLGHVETKDVGENLAAMEKGKPPSGEQFGRYRDGLPNWILTDYLEFRWYVSGEPRMAVRLAELDAKGKLKPIPNGEAELENLLKAFLTQKSLTIGTAKDLAERMAGMTRIIRDLIIKAFEHEVEKGFLHKWLAAFRETLIPDLEENQFADMFAQTLAYGLFAARVHTPVNKEFSREMAAYNLPKTNPFLRKLFSEIAGVDMPETIGWAVNEIVELLNHADMASVLKDFGKGQGKSDPVVHFYETFLAAYDPKMRELRGVYYTPEPVVSYIVRSIDHLLKTRFNRTKGLADENTLILDPATGTATFLYFVVDQIHQKFAKQKGAWDGYVEKHLLNRIFGFELLIAPYAVAHLKLGMQLQETGYKFGSEQRLGIYLTNTLEEAAKKSDQLFASWITEEANAAAKIKRDDPILVILGNPPYSGHSANKGEWITQLVGDYKRGVVGLDKPGQAKWLQDDYVKFIRFAQWRIEKTGEGVLGFITNHSYLDNPTFRGMREQLIKCFNEIFIYDLHGSAKKREKSPDGSKDENVFDIQQGVAVLLCIKEKGNVQPARFHHSHLWGTREGKYDTLSSTDSSRTDWTDLFPTAPFYLFTPEDAELRIEYDSYWKLTEIFSVNGSPAPGFATQHDDFAISWSAKEMKAKVRKFLTSTSESEARTFFSLCPQDQWQYERAMKELTEENWEKELIAVLYRPFDIRWTVFNRNVAVHRRTRVSQHYLAGANLGICVGKAGQVVGGSIWNLLFVTKAPSELNLFYRGGACNLPLYIYDTESLEKPKKTGGGGTMFMAALFESSPGYITRRANINPKFIAELTQKLGLKWLPVDSGDLKKTIGPEDVFNYAYAVFHSPAYRERYAEFLKIDFPRLPLTSDLKLFRALAAKGAELVALHLMESPKLDELITEFPVKGDGEVEKVQYTDADQRVWINAKQYFGGVPKAVWEFHVGGYQVCEKWLKDRKGRNLSYEDIQHYQKTVVALSETIRLMTEIDEAIEEQGGWPLK